MTLGNNEDRISRGLPQSRAAGFAMIRDAVAYPGLKDRSGETRAYLFFFFFFFFIFFSFALSFMYEPAGYIPVPVR